MANGTHRARAEVLPVAPAGLGAAHVPAIDRLVDPVAAAGWEYGWEGPTLAELAERVEHQFGKAPGLAGIFTLGFGRDEPLTPGDVHQVCEHLGLPAEDFGVGG